MSTNDNVSDNQGFYTPEDFENNHQNKNVDNALTNNEQNLNPDHFANANKSKEKQELDKQALDRKNAYEKNSGELLYNDVPEHASLDRAVAESNAENNVHPIDTFHDDEGKVLGRRNLESMKRQKELDDEKRKDFESDMKNRNKD